MGKIAIIGMGCLFPGYTNKNEFWEKLVKNQPLTEVHYFNGRRVERGALPKNPLKMGEFLKQSFGDAIPKELNRLGEVYKWTCYVCNEALRENGYNRQTEWLKRTGLVMGNTASPARDSLSVLKSLMQTNLKSIVGGILNNNKIHLNIASDDDQSDPFAAFSDAEISTRTAQILSLGGPVLSLNVACATPLFAIKLASYYLNTYKADLMIAGSSNESENVKISSSLFDTLGILSDEGKSRPLNKESDGLIMSSGAGAFALKRLPDAVRDGDSILAVVESIGWSNDAGGKSILAPDNEGQIRAFQDAYRTGLSAQIDYIECHATGTKAGDQLELESISRFFGQKGVRPYIGALKGSTGHFFTSSANGAAAKIILSMKNNLIPATIRVSEPLESRDKSISAKEVVTKNMEWPVVRKKRAGVNAFGFGGVNAHMVISEYNSSDNESIAVDTAQSSTFGPIAIVGMGLHIGGYDSVNKYFNALMKGSATWQKPDQYRWSNAQADKSKMEELGIEKMPKGAYINNFDFDYVKFKFAPKDNPFILRKDMLLLNVAAQALDDANIQPGKYKRTAVIVSCAQDFSDGKFMCMLEIEDVFLKSLKQACPDLNSRQIQEVFNILRRGEKSVESPDTITGVIPNIKASRISAHWKFEGPSFLLMEGENSVARSIEIANFLLNEQAVDCVVVGAIAFAGEFEHIFMQKQIGNFEKLLNSGIGEGAAVLVLKRPEQAKRDGNNIYSLINNVSISGNVSCRTDQFSRSQIEDCIEKAIVKTNFENTSIGYVDFVSSLQPQGAKTVEESYKERYSNALDNTFMVGSAETITGCCFNLGLAASLVKNALQLHFKIKFPLDVNQKFSSWICREKTRMAISGSMASNGSLSQIVMTESQSVPELAKVNPLPQSTYLLPIKAANGEQLFKKILEIEKNAKEKKGLLALVNEAIEAFEKSKNEQEMLTLALLCTSKETLLLELEKSKEGVQRAMARGEDWTSNQGSYFSPRPLKQRAKTVWMYPPGRIVTPVKIYEMIALYPELAKYIESDIADLFNYLNRNDKANLEFDSSPFAKYNIEFTITKLSTELLKTKAGVLPDIALGASMGEIALPYILGCLGNDVDRNISAKNLLEYIHVLNDTSVFEKYFGRPAEEWESWYVVQSRQIVEQVVESEPAVFIALVCSPTDIIISGERSACRRVLNRVGGLHSIAEGSSYVHTPISELHRDSLYSLGCKHGLFIKNNLPYALYCAHTGTPLGTTVEEYSRNVVNIMTKTVDFVKVVNSAYEDGGRIFIDLGTNETCKMWARKTLSDRKDAIVLSLHSLNYSFEESWNRLLASMISHGIPVSLQKMYRNLNQANKASYIGTISMGFPHYSENVASAENQQRVRALASFSENNETSNIDPSVDNQKKAVSDHFRPIDQHEKGQEMVRNRQADLDSKLAPIDLKAIYARTAMRNASAYLNYQQSEAELMHYIGDRLREELNEISVSSQVPATKSTSIAKRKRPCIWNYEDILELTNGDISKVWGAKYQQFDKYPVRTRMPSPPFLFVSRVTKIDAEFGNYRPSTIEMEYDVTDDCILVKDGKATSYLMDESGHVCLLLLSYMGIDAIMEGKRRYRHTNSESALHGDLPSVGEIIRGVLEITSFVNSGDTMLVLFTYRCFCGERHVSTVKAVGGFFTDEELRNSKGLVSKSKIVSSVVELGNNHPYIACKRFSFDEEALNKIYDAALLSQLNEGIVSNFSSPEKCLKYLQQASCRPSLRMVDRITEINPHGGRWRLGEIWGEKLITDDHWAFKAHFKNDPIFPGCILTEGLNQLLSFLVVCLGVHVKYSDKEIGAILDLSTKSIFRGQVEKGVSRLKYHIDIKEIEYGDKFKMIVDAEIYCNDKYIAHSENIGIESR